MCLRPQLTNEVNDILKHIDDLRVLALDEPGCPKGRLFLPRYILKTYLVRERIRKLLEYHNVRGVNYDAIRNDYLAVFATLVRIKKTRYITHFTPHDWLADSGLPFRFGYESSWPRECRDFFTEFYEAQWEFCAQELREGRLNDSRFHERTIIPITSREPIKSSPDSMVEKVVIHADYNTLVHRNANNDPSNVFVLKSYKENNSTLYYNEIYAYKMLKDEDIARNVVHFHGCWMHNGRFCILLEFVPGGTLADLFTRNHPTSLDDRLFLWKNLLLLLDLVDRIHCHTDPENERQNVQGVHQDIKPGNILVAPSISRAQFDLTFKLVDFALTYFNTSTAQEAGRRRRDGRGTQTYSAPECFRNERDRHDEHSPRNADPSKDIWSIGCVLSLALVWSVLGPDRVKEYQDRLVNATAHLPGLGDTAYSGCFHNGTEVLQEVHFMHMEALRARGPYDQIISELVPIIENMLIDDVQRRPTARDIRKRCQEALSRAIELCHLDDARFPEAFRTHPESSSPPQTPPELPPKSDRRGLGIEVPANSLPQTPISSGTIGSSKRNSYIAGSPSISQFSKHRSIDTVVSGHSPSYDCSHNGSSPTDTRTISPYGGSHTSVRSTKQDFAPPIPGSASGRQSTWDRPIVDDPHGTNGMSLYDNGHSAIPVSPGSPRSEKTRSAMKPHATLSQVQDWIEKKKKKIQAPRPITEDDLNALNGRDQIFLIDNSKSMRGYWPRVRAAFETLGYLVKHLDPDGIEEYFTNSKQSGRHRDRERLLRLFDTIPLRGQGGMEVALGKILEKCMNKESTRPSIFNRNRPWGVSIYILTDGVWTGDDESLCGIPELIKNTVNKMKTRVKLGIQFIQFGHDPIGTKRLEMLDDGLKQHGVEMDIIDHTHVDGNVFKMLLGSFDSSWDGLPSTADSTSATHHRYGVPGPNSNPA